MDNPDLYRDFQPDCHCLNCRDQGIVHAWNPAFLAGYRQAFLLVGRIELAVAEVPAIARKWWQEEGEFSVYRYEPSDWVHQARGWWREKDQGPISEMVLCNCNCPRAERYREEIEQYRNQSRAVNKHGREVIVGLPACGHNQFNPERQCQRTWDAFTDLQRWFKDAG